MRQWLVEHPRIAAALGLALGLPAVAAAGLGVTLLVGFAVRPWLPVAAPLSLSLWVGGFAVTCVPLWLLVSRTVRRGGMSGAGLGIAFVVLAAVGLWTLGWLQQTLQPQNGMAGVGPAILTYVLGFFALVALVMAVIAKRVLTR